MNAIGVDLHKKIITVCVMDQSFKPLARATLHSDQPEKLLEFFRAWRPFKVVVEATASYSWFVGALEPLAEEVVLANPKKLRVIAESTKKTDRLDAQVLAEFLARDMIPRAYMPTPGQRQHRALVRHRQYLRGRITSVRCKIRHILADDNAEVANSLGNPSYFSGDIDVVLQRRRPRDPVLVGDAVELNPRRDAADHDPVDRGQAPQCQRDRRH